MTDTLSPTQAIDKATELYAAAVAKLRAALEAFVTKGQTPDPDERARGEYCYPELRLSYDPDGPVPPLSRAFAKLSEPGIYVSTITQPTFFRSYFLEQLEQIGTGQRAGREFLQALQRAEQARLVGGGELLEALLFR